MSDDDDMWGDVVPAAEAPAAAAAAAAAATVAVAEDMARLNAVLHFDTVNLCTTSAIPTSRAVRHC